MSPYRTDPIAVMNRRRDLACADARALRLQAYAAFWNGVEAFAGDAASRAERAATRFVQRLQRRPAALGPSGSAA